LICAEQNGFGSMLANDTREYVQRVPCIATDFWSESAGEIAAALLQHDDIVLACIQRVLNASAVLPLRQCCATLDDHFAIYGLPVDVRECLKHGRHIADIGQAIADKQDPYGGW